VKTHYVLIDFENVQPESLEPLNHDHFKVLVFIGAKQGKLSRDIVMSIQKLGSRAEYIEISGNGTNALDFHIAYYIGRFAVEEPSAHFHIVSKDTGFDPLIRHLKSKKLLAGRVESISDILSPTAKSATAKPASTKPATTNAASAADERFLRLVAVLTKQRGQSRPRKEKTLKSSISALFKKEGLSASEVNTLVDQLKSKGKIKVDGSNVTYHL
jgi:hypothetical protein